MTQPAKTPQLEVSAGGLIISATDPNLVALIRHRNRGRGSSWCIPKGHVEHAESLEQTAIREVAEETGIQGSVVQKLDTIRYSFLAGGTRIKKTVHHYLLQQTGGELGFENDPTGEVTKVAWFKLTEVDSVLAHINERRIAKIAREILGLEA